MHSATNAPQLAHMPFMGATMEEVEINKALPNLVVDQSMASYIRAERVWRYQEATIFSLMLIVVVLICAIPWASS
jgi:hypothetical protein